LTARWVAFLHRVFDYEDYGEEATRRAMRAGVRRTRGFGSGGVRGWRGRRAAASATGPAQFAHTSRSYVMRSSSLRPVNAPGYRIRSRKGCDLLQVTPYTHSPLLPGSAEIGARTPGVRAPEPGRRGRAGGNEGLSVLCPVGKATNPDDDCARSARSRSVPPTSPVRSPRKPVRT